MRLIFFIVAKKKETCSVTTSSHRNKILNLEIGKSNTKMKPCECLTMVKTNPAIPISTFGVSVSTVMLFSLLCVCRRVWMPYMKGCYLWRMVEISAIGFTYMCLRLKGNSVFFFFHEKMYFFEFYHIGLFFDFKAPGCTFSL